MPWPIRYHDQEPENPQPGDMWPVPYMVEGPGAEDFRANYLSEEYFQRWYGKRPPLMVQLPNGRPFCVDSRPSAGGSGWDLTGEAPNITVHPSIAYANFSRERGYHGWLQNGVLSDDVEGRRYEQEGRATR